MSDLPKLPLTFFWPEMLWGLLAVPLLFLAATGAVFLAGAAILDSVRYRTAARAAAVFAGAQR